MTILLEVLSIVAAAALLTVLLVHLLLIRKAIESVRSSLQSITWGVRAIARQMEPLGPRTEALLEHLRLSSSALETLAPHLAGFARKKG